VNLRLCDFGGKMSQDGQFEKDQYIVAMQRVNESGYRHWLETSSIVTNINILLAVTLAGQIYFGDFSWKVQFTVGCMIVSSMASTMVSYYCLQIGAQFTYGHLRPGQILQSFMLAILQLVLYVWPQHVLKIEGAREYSLLDQLRHWLIMQILFIGFAGTVNIQAIRMRKSVHMYLGRIKQLLSPICEFVTL
jgi:hypothetical protein